MESTYEEMVDRLFYSDPEKCIRKALCMVKWRGKEVGYGCLLKDPDVKHPELSKYFIITTSQVISEDKFASSGYHYQVVFEEKSGSKKEALYLWDIIKSSAFGLHTPGASVSDEDGNENDQISQGDGNDDLYKPKEPVFFGSTLVVILIDSKSPKLRAIFGGKCSVLKNLPRMASVNHGEELRYYNGNKICTYSIRSGDSSRESVSKHGTVLFQSGLSVVGILHSSSCNNDQQVISPIWLKSSLLEMMEDEKKKKEEQRRRDEEENTRKEEERNKKELEQMPMEVEEERKTKQEEEGEAEERKSEMKCAEDEKKKKEEQKKREEEENMRKEEERNKKELEQMPMEVEEERKTKQEEEDEEEEKKSEIKHAETSIPLHGDNRRPLLPPDYNALQRVLQEASQAGYDDLHFKAEQLKSQIPPLFMKEKGNFSPNIRRDENSQKLLPASKLKGEYVALHTTGDGNCLFRAASILAYGNEDKHQEMRVRIVVELLCNRSYYLNVPYIEERIRAQELFIQGKSSHKGRGNGQGELNKPVLEVAFEEEVRETCKDATWASDWHLQALATVLRHPLKIVFAEGIRALERYFDDNIHPRVGYSMLDPLVILWTSTGPLETTGLNHFVPLVPADEVHSLGKNKSGSASRTDVTDSKEDQNAGEDKKSEEHSKEGLDKQSTCTSKTELFDQTASLQISDVPQDFVNRILSKKIDAIPYQFYSKICQKLDIRQTANWNDYRQLGEKVGLAKDTISLLEQRGNAAEEILKTFQTTKENSVERLKTILEEMKRDDVVAIIDEWILSEWNHSKLKTATGFPEEDVEIIKGGTKGRGIFQVDGSRATLEGPEKKSSSTSKTELFDQTAPSLQISDVHQDSVNRILSKKIDAIPYQVYSKICQKLDIRQKTNCNDYRQLGEKVGVDKDTISLLEQNGNATDEILKKFATTKENSVGRLKTILEEMKRDDVVAIIDDWIRKEIKS